METLSGARWRPRPHLDASPAVGAAEGSWEPGRAPRGPSAAPPGAAARPARPPHAGATASPRRGPTKAPRTPPAGRAPAPAPRRASHSPDRTEGSASRAFLPARPSASRSPSSSSRGQPRGARPDQVTRTDAQPGLLPALPPRGPAAAAAAAPGGSRAAMLLPSRACAAPATCSLGKVGAGKERRRGAVRGGPAPNPREGLRALPPPGVLVPNSGMERGENSTPLSKKKKFEKTCPCPRGPVAGKYLGEPLGPSPKVRTVLGGVRGPADYSSCFASSSHLGLAARVKGCLSSGRTPEISWHPLSLPNPGPILGPLSCYEKSVSPGTTPRVKRSPPFLPTAVCSWGHATGNSAGEGILGHQGSATPGKWVVWGDLLPSPSWERAVLTQHSRVGQSRQMTCGTAGADCATWPQAAAGKGRGCS